MINLLLRHPSQSCVCELQLTRCPQSTIHSIPHSRPPFLPPCFHPAGYSFLAAQCAPNGAFGIGNKIAVVFWGMESIFISSPIPGSNYSIGHR